MSDDPQKEAQEEAQKEAEPTGAEADEAEPAATATASPFDASGGGTATDALADDAVAPDRPHGAGAPAAEQAGGESPPASGAASKPPVSSSVATLAAYRPSYVFLVVVTLVNLVADLASKHWAKTAFEAAHPAAMRKLVVIEGYLNLIYAKNRGGAWGLLQNEAEALRRPFFLVVSVAAIVFIVSLYRKLAPDQRALKWGLPLVLGGALGNLIDRIRYGFVVDFIDVYTTVNGQVKHWPTFNVADISICIGVGLMAIDMFTPRSKKAKATAKPTEAAAEQADGSGASGPADARGGAPAPASDTAPNKPKADGDGDEMSASTPPVQGT